MNRYVMITIYQRQTHFSFFFNGNCVESDDKILQFIFMPYNSVVLVYLNKTVYSLYWEPCYKKISCIFNITPRNTMKINYMRYFKATLLRKQFKMVTFHKPLYDSCMQRDF